MHDIALIPDAIWDGRSDEATSGVAVVIREGRIHDIVARGSLANDITTHPLPGCTLLPGLIDAHVHYSTAMGLSFLAAGVTTIRDVGNDLDWILDQRDRHACDVSLGPRIVCCGVLHDGARAYWRHMGRSHTDVEALRTSIQHHVDRGVDQIKLYAHMPSDFTAAGVEESHRLGMFALAHLQKTSAEDACRAGLDGIEHLAGCDIAFAPAAEEELDALATLMLASNVWVDPTLVVWDRLGRINERSFFNDARRAWVHPTHLDIWRRYLSREKQPQSRLYWQIAIPHLKRFMMRLHERGCRIGLGTDTPFPHLAPGFSVHDELAMYVDAGMKPVDALRAATIHNAAMIGLGEQAGVIQRGASADLVAIRGNPLTQIDDISNIDMVWRAGHSFTPESLFTKAKRLAHQTLDDPITLDLLRYVNGEQ